MCIYIYNTHKHIFSYNFIPEGKMELTEAEQLTRLTKMMGEMY